MVGGYYGYGYGDGYGYGGQYRREAEVIRLASGTYTLPSTLPEALTAAGQMDEMMTILPLATAKEHIYIEADVSMDDDKMSGFILAALQKVRMMLGRDFYRTRGIYRFTPPHYGGVAIEARAAVVPQGTPANTFTYYPDSPANASPMDIEMTISDRTDLYTAYKPTDGTWPGMAQREDALTMTILTGKPWSDVALDMQVAIKQAALMLVGHYYNFRENTAMMQAYPVPDGAADLLNPYRRYPVA